MLRPPAEGSVDGRRSPCRHHVEPDRSMVSDRSAGRDEASGRCPGVKLRSGGKTPRSLCHSPQRGCRAIGVFLLSQREGRTLRLAWFDSSPLGWRGPAMAKANARHRRRRLRLWLDARAMDSPPNKLLDDCFAHDRRRLRHAEALAILKERVRPVVGVERVPWSRPRGVSWRRRRWRPGRCRRTPMPRSTATPLPPATTTPRPEPSWPSRAGRRRGIRWRASPRGARRRASSRVR